MGDPETPAKPKARPDMRSSVRARAHERSPSSSERFVPPTAIGRTPHSGLLRPSEALGETLEVAGGDDLAESDPVELPSLVGEVIEGRYRIEEVLSHGGMGAVFVATQLELERRVAIKVMLGKMGMDPSAVRRFQREARTAGRIGHPNIVDVHDLGRLEDGSPYIVMELLEGESLADTLVRRGRLPLEEVIDLLAPVANALDIVHAQGVVHRDIKPENIFLAKRIDGSEVVKLLDFGLAAFQEPEDKDRLTAAGSLLGTPHYMPPEGIEGARDIGPEGDVYSLASVAFELLTGLLPFPETKSVRELILLKVGGAAPTMRERSGLEVPASIEEAVAKGLAKTPQERYSSATALIDALRRAAEAHPGWLLPDQAPQAPAPQAPAPQAPAPPALRPRLLLSLLAALTLAAGIGLWLALR